jgi:hypothetical protein
MSRNESDSPSSPRLGRAVLRRRPILAWEAALALGCQTCCIADCQFTFHASRFPTVEHPEMFFLALIHLDSP